MKFVAKFQYYLIFAGEVNIAQEDLSSFLATAQDLRVKGLTQQTSNTQTGTKPEVPTNNPETANNCNKYKQEKLLESEEDIAAIDEKENTFHDNDKTSSSASDQDEQMEGNLNISGELDHLPSEEVDLVLSQHISRQAGLDRTDYVCLICQKYCKSRDECANHIEVRPRQQLITFFTKDYCFLGSPSQDSAVLSLLFYRAHLKGRIEAAHIQKT